MDTQARTSFFFEGFGGGWSSVLRFLPRWPLEGMSFGSSASSNNVQHQPLQSPTETSQSVGGARQFSRLVSMLTAFHMGARGQAGI